jgi:hypothetical protein
MQKVLIILVIIILLILFYNIYDNFDKIDPPTIFNKKIAIILPYREQTEQNRSQQLDIITKYYNNLNNPNIDIYIIEQGNDKPFNKGILLNAGHDIISKKNKYNNEIHHDIDMLPNTDLIKYFFSDDVIGAYPEPYYDTNIGGITVVPLNIMNKVNGYTNDMYGWGIEDDNFYYRLNYNNIIPYHVNSGKVTKLNHIESSRSFYENNKIQNNIEFKNKFDTGLSNLKYNIISETTVNNIPKYTIDF